MNRVEKNLELKNELFNEMDIFKDDPDLKEIINNYLFGEVYSHGTLDIKLRELITLVVLTTSHTLDTLDDHVKASLKIELTPLEIKEAIYQCTPYVGFLKVYDALKVVNKVFKESNIRLPIESASTTTEETRFEKGFEAQCSAFAREHIQAGHDNAPKELKHIQNYLSEYCLGDFYTRKGLDMKTRELLTFCMIATLGGCENQLRAHTNANIIVGNTRDTLIEAITQCQPYIGFPRTLNAINIINEVSKK